MGNVCSPGSCNIGGDDDNGTVLRNLDGSQPDLQLRENLMKARRSTKRLKTLTDTQITDQPDLSGSPTCQNSERHEGQKNEQSLMKKLSLVFETNKGRLKAMDQDLKSRYELIHQLTSQFEVYIGMI